MSKTKKTRMIIALSVGVALLLAAGGTVAAFGPGGFGMCGGRFKEMVLAHVDDRVEELNLSPAQQKQYQALRARLEANLEKSAKERRQAFMNLKDEVDKASPDVKAAVGRIKQRLGMIPQMMGANLDLFAEFYGILTPEQQAKVLKKARKRMARIDQFCLAPN